MTNRAYARNLAIRYTRYCNYAKAKQTANLPKTDGRLSRMVEHLVRDTKMSYADIVAKVREEFPSANTSTKSVASVACVMRKKGVNVPLRLKLNMVG
jgi:hypothetical protein